jgi:hypothetical protein
MMYQAACHQRPIVDGEVGRVLAISLHDVLETHDLVQQRRQLTENKIKYIVIHRQEGEQSFTETDGHWEYQRLYPLVYFDENSEVFRVY